MPTIKRIEFPDGSIRRVEVPDGATDEQILEFVSSSYKPQEAPQQPSQPVTAPAQPQGDIARYEAAMRDAYAGSGTDQYGNQKVTDLPAVTSRPDFSGVSATVDTSEVPESGFKRDVKMGGRSVIRGALGLLGDFGGDAFNHYLVPGQQPTYRQAGDAISDKLGLPAPTTARERIKADIGEGLTGTGLTMGGGALLNYGKNALTTLAPTIRSKVADLLTAQPVLQAVSTATGTGASSLVRENGGSTGAQVAAGLAGGVSPGVTQAGTAAAVRGGLRGFDGSPLQATINQFRTAGTTPTVGQATGNRRTQALETLLGTVPGGAGVMAGKAGRQADQVSSRLDDLAGELTPRGNTITPTQAGDTIKRGITGPDGFLAETRKVSNDLYDRLDETIAPDTRVEVGNVTQALKELNAAIPGAPSVSKFFQNGRIMGIEGGLASDIGGIDAVLTRPGVREQADALRTQLVAQADEAERAYAQQVAAIQSENEGLRSLGLRTMKPVPPRPAIPTKADIDAQVRQSLEAQIDNKLPYEALKKLRTLVGGELENYSIASDIPRSKWKAVYQALSKDLEQVAGQSPEAKRAWDRANTYYNARSKRIEAIDHVIDRAGGGEKIYSAAFSGIKDGATTLRKVMQSLPDDAQKEVAAAFVRRMGKATGSKQNDAGDAFSMETFLTNWGNMSTEARKVMFDRFGPNYSRSMDRVAAMANNVRDGSKVFANPSGTGARTALVGSIGSAGATIGTLLATGNVGGAALAAGGAGAAMAGTNWLARKMTDPKFVGWLAQSTELPLAAIPSQVHILRGIAEKEKDPDYAAAADFLEQSTKDRKGNQ